MFGYLITGDATWIQATTEYGHWNMLKDLELLSVEEYLDISGQIIQIAVPKGRGISSTF